MDESQEFLMKSGTRRHIGSFLNDSRLAENEAFLDVFRQLCRRINTRANTSMIVFGVTTLQVLGERVAGD